MGGDKIPDGPAGRGPFDANDAFVLPDGASLPRLIHQPQTATLRRRVVHIKELAKDVSGPLRGVVGACLDGVMTSVSFWEVSFP
jgi:hypothetical protein